MHFRISHGLSRSTWRSTASKDAVIRFDTKQPSEPAWFVGCRKSSWYIQPWFSGPFSTSRNKNKRSADPWIRRLLVFSRHARRWSRTDLQLFALLCDSVKGCFPTLEYRPKTLAGLMQSRFINMTGGRTPKFNPCLQHTKKEAKTCIEDTSQAGNGDKSSKCVPWHHTKASPPTGNCNLEFAISHVFDSWFIYSNFKLENLEYTFRQDIWFKTSPERISINPEVGSHIIAVMGLPRFEQQFKPTLSKHYIISS